MEQHTTASKNSYYLPEPSHWPLFAWSSTFFLAVGGANWIHGNEAGPYLFGIGILLVFTVFFGWFRTVIRESLAGLYNAQVDKTFRWGMIWFIISEVCFFGTLFGALFYARLVTIPTLGGEYPNAASALTHLVLWPDFKAVWPLFVNPAHDVFTGMKSVMETWGIPALNTLTLLTSGVTITWAHWAMVKHKRTQLILGLLLTVLLGCLFLYLQAHEYYTAYAEKQLTLASGIYGTTFFVLTGFHGLHVTLGTIMLIVILIRAWKNHFAENRSHFAFEAVSWYWHFVDVVWLFLFVFVYWI